MSLATIVHIRNSIRLLSLFMLAALLSLGAISCGDDTEVINPGDNNTGAEVQDTLAGSVKGVMKAGQTYYLAADSYVEKGDTLTVEPGARLLALGIGDVKHTLFVRGALLAHGSKESMIYFGPIESRRYFGSWGGIQCDSPSVISFKWCRIDYAGGIRPSGQPKPAIYFFSNAANTSEFYMEDCYMYKPEDDGFMLYGGKGHILRSTFAYIGKVHGAALNFKTGFKGTVAYNYVWNCLDQAIQVETSKDVLFPQTDLDIHNNTVINYGFRNPSRPGAGVIIDKFARARIYNNIFVNGRLGLKVTTTGDAEHTEYGNNLFYTTIDSLQQYFYPPDGVGSPRASDLIQVDPMFTTFDPSVDAAEDHNDPTPRTGSPIFGAGNGAYDPDLGAFTAKRNR